MGEYTCRMDGTNVGESVGRTKNKYQATDGRGYGCPIGDDSRGFGLQSFRPLAAAHASLSSVIVRIGRGV
jgi:hypothetical protein